MKNRLKWIAGAMCALLVVSVTVGCTSVAGSGGGKAASVSGPAVLRTTAAYDDWGVRIESPPPEQVNGPVEFEITSREALQLLPILRDLESGYYSPDLVSAEPTGSGWRMAVAFPKSGRYELSIIGTSVARGDRKYVELAKLTFDVHIVDSRWHNMPALERLGMAVDMPPIVDARGKLEVVVAAPSDTSVGMQVANADTGKLVGTTTATRIEKGNWHLTAHLSEDGVYRVSIYGTSTAGEELAAVSTISVRLTDKKNARLAAALDSQNPSAIAAALDAGADPNVDLEDYSRVEAYGTERDVSAPPVFFVLQWYEVPDKQIEACKLLQSRGADFTAVTSEHQTVISAFLDNPPTDPAAARRLFSELVACGADPGQKTQYIYVRNDEEVRAPVGVLVKLSQYTDEKKEQLAGLVPLLVKSGAGLDATYPWGDTLLEQSFQRLSPGGKAIVRALLRAGVDPDADELRSCAQWMGSSRFDGDFGFVSDVLSATTHINDRGSYGETVITSLVKDSKMEPAMFRRSLSLLVAHAADLRVADRKGYTPLMVAISAVNLPAIDAILALGVDPNEKGENGSTVMHAISGIRDAGDAIALADRLISLGADINARDGEGRTLFYLLCTSSSADVALLKHLVAKGADPSIPNIDGFTPMGYAQDRGNLDLVRYLTALDVPRSRGGRPAANDAPACRAVLYEDFAAVRSARAADLEEMTARTPDGIPATPLHLAAELGSPALIGTLSSRGVNWNVGDRYGRTPLEKALLAHRNTAVVQALLHGGADPSKENDWGESALSRAAGAASPLFPQLLSASRNPDWDAVCLAMTTSAPIDFIKSVGQAKWSDYARDLCATFGRTDILRFLSETRSAGGKSWEELLARAGRNEVSYRDYVAEASSRLPGAQVPGSLRNRRGTYSLRLTQWSPWMEGDPGINLADYPVTVFVPDGYDGSDGWGLVVSMMNAKSSSQAPAAAYIETLKKHHLIYVGFDPYNGLFENGSSGYLDTNHERFCLAVAYHMFGAYNIDRRRVYLTGFSWGGRLTGEIVPKQPNVFTGGIAVGGCFITGNRVIPSLRYAQAHTSMVLATGDWDYNRQETANGYNMLTLLGYRAHFLQQPLSGHARISGENFEKAVTILDSEAGM